MAKLEDLQGALKRLNSGGIINLGGEFLKKKILRNKIKKTYGENLEDKDIEEMVKEIYESGRGEFMCKLDSELALISSSLSSVVSQAPSLLAQMATIPLAKIQTTVVGPTVPNPVDIKNTLDQIKVQADSLASILSIAIGKVIELGIEDEIPDSVVTVVDIIASIKNFPL